MALTEFEGGPIGVTTVSFEIDTLCKIACTQILLGTLPANKTMANTRIGLKDAKVTGCAIDMQRMKNVVVRAYEKPTTANVVPEEHNVCAKEGSL